MRDSIDYLDTNNLRIISPRSRNSADLVSLSGTSVRILGTSHEYETDSFVVLVDSTQRFMAATLVQPDGSWKLQLSPNSVAKDRGALNGSLYVMRSGDNSAVPLDMTREIRADLNRCIDALLPDDAQDVPSFRDRYVELIVGATKERYVSTSICDCIKTGNNYQSVDFGALLRKGARPLRETFLHKIDFKGATVLDIGANTGEVSRLLRRLGANLVDGYEYDPFFVETGRAMNAALGMTRVSLFQGDATKSELYDGMHYDIAVALSVYVYVVNRLAEIAKVTDLLVFETHTLDHGLGFYLDRMRPHFPVVRHLGFSENNKDPRKSRAFLVFAESDDQIQRRVAERHLVVRPYFRNRFLEEHTSVQSSDFRRFCEDLRARSSVNRQGAKSLSFGNHEYFTAFLTGYLDYLVANRSVRSDNTFLESYRRSIEGGTLDPGLAPLLADDGALRAKVRAKFADIEFFAKGQPDLTPPVTIVPAEKGQLEFTDVSGRMLSCDIFDGHHRFFIAQLFGYQTLRYEIATAGSKSWSQTVEANYTLTL